MSDIEDIIVLKESIDLNEHILSCLDCKRSMNNYPRDDVLRFYICDKASEIRKSYDSLIVLMGEEQDVELIKDGREYAIFSKHDYEKKVFDILIEEVRYESAGA